MINSSNQEGKGYIFKEEDAGIFAAKLIRDDINFAMQNAEEKFNAAIEGKDEKEIKEIKKKYFDEKNIGQDLFYIDMDIPAALYCAPLQSVLRFTDYYPEELTAFLDKCIKERKKDYEEQS